MDWVNDLAPHWHWLAIGLLLAAAEMAAPGVFLIWLALAAIVTGLVTWAMPIGVPVQIVLFAVLAVASVFIGRRFLRANPIQSADPMLNDRGGQAVGETVVLTQAIVSGTGRARLGDSEWLVKGPDAEVGARMRVAGHEGTVLVVEHLH